MPLGDALTFDGPAPFVKPRTLSLHEIPEIIQQYAYAATLAKEAGFDGVELHAANGYLIDQFLNDLTNLRTDGYGGSVHNRARFLFEALDACLSVWEVWYKATQWRESNKNTRDSFRQCTSKPHKQIQHPKHLLKRITTPTTTPIRWTGRASGYPIVAA